MNARIKVIVLKTPSAITLKDHSSADAKMGSREKIHSRIAQVCAQLQKYLILTDVVS